MASLSMPSVMKKPSSRKACASKPQIRSKKVPAVPKGRSIESVLKRPSRLKSASANPDWREFTPETINGHRCLARTWDDGYGGQCTRSASNDTSRLCAAHKVESQRTIGLTHGLVTGSIPARKLAEFQNVKAFRQACRLDRLQISKSSEVQEVAMVTDGDIAPVNVSTCHGNGHLRTVQCWREKTILPHRRPGMRIKGGNVFPREHFEKIAANATQHAPDSLYQQVGYATPLLGSLCCTLVGFERDLEGIRPRSICTYEWRFTHERIHGVEVAHRVKYKCRNVYYKRKVLRPPRAVTIAACVALALVNASVCQVL